MKRNQIIKGHRGKILLSGILVIVLAVLIFFSLKTVWQDNSQPADGTDIESSGEIMDETGRTEADETDTLTENTSYAREESEEQSTQESEEAAKTVGTGESGGESGAVKESAEETQNEEAAAPTQSTQMNNSAEAEEIASGDITCDMFASYSGQFVEDGRDELVENVAAVMVTNHSDIDGIPAIFVISGLPAGESAWVMEYTRLTVADSSVFTYEDSITSFQASVINDADEVTITAEGNNLIVVNNTPEVLENVYVYYKTVHADGNYLGGITYRVDLGDLEPGVPVETIAGHYSEENSRIIRISWQGSE